MCEAVLKFTLSHSVSHLPILSREQMKKKVLHLLPIIVASDAQPEGKQTPPPTWNIVTAFGQSAVVPGIHLLLMPRALQLVTHVIYIPRACKILGSATLRIT